MSDDAERSRRAIEEGYREVARRSGGRVIDEGGLCLVVGRHPSPVIVNNSFRTDTGASARGVVERAEQAFLAASRHPVLMTFNGRDADVDRALDDAGWRHEVDLPVMTVRGRVDVPGVDGASVRRLAGTPDDLELVRDLLERGFGDEPEDREIVAPAFALAASIEPRDLGTVVVERDGVASAIAVVYRLGREALLAWVGTVPEARRRGLGALVTATATNIGFELGAGLVTLQASAMGRSVYERLGFVVVDSSAFWIKPD